MRVLMPFMFKVVDCVPRRFTEKRKTAQHTQVQRTGRPTTTSMREPPGQQFIPQGANMRRIIRRTIRRNNVEKEIAREHLRPEFEMLLEILDELTPPGTPRHKLQQLGFSVVGQCLFYRVSRTVVDSLVEPESRDGHFTVDSLTDHICDTLLAALGRGQPLSDAAESVGHHERATVAEH